MSTSRGPVAGYPRGFLLAATPSATLTLEQIVRRSGVHGSRKVKKVLAEYCLRYHWGNLSKLSSELPGLGLDGEMSINQARNILLKRGWR